MTGQLHGETLEQGSVDANFNPSFSYDSGSTVGILVSLSLSVNSSHVYVRAAGNPVSVHLPIITCSYTVPLVGAVFCKLACS